MHRVKKWAHTTAQQNKFNPWAQTADSVLNGKDAANANGNEGVLVGGEPEKNKPKKPIARRIWEPFKVALFHSWVNVLLVFVPVGVAVHFVNTSPGVVFAMNAIAIVPLAGLLTLATESVAHRLGPTLGALMNVSFGNAVELIIFIALVKNEIRIVQASLIGSILANLLLILGMAFFIGGLEYQEQFYDSTITQTSAALLALAVLSLLIPTAFHASFSDVTLADQASVTVSRGTSVIMLVVYVLYLLFQLKSHSYLYQGTPQHIIDKKSQPGFLARFDSTTTDENDTSSTKSGGSGSYRRVSKKIRAKLGRKRREEVEIEQSKEDTPHENGEASTDAAEKGKEKEEKMETAAPETTVPPTSTATTTGAAKKPNATLGFRAPPVFRAATNPDPNQPNFQRSVSQTQLRRMRSAPNDEGWRDIQDPKITKIKSRGTQPINPPEEDEPPLSQTASIVLLLISTGLVALCAEFLVDSINALVLTSPLSEAFIGLIILPIVGNAAEHVTAITVAAKNKMDLALGVSLGSSIQIALFVTPVVVLLGWILNKEMSLYFNLFETASLFVSTFIVNFLVLDGRSNYLEGALLCACYIIVAIAAYFFPDSQSQSASTRGPGA